MAQMASFTKNTIGKITFVILFIFSFLTFAVGNSEAYKNVSSGNFESAPAVSNVTSPDTLPDLTMAKYRKLKDGMSYRQVVDIIGEEGKEISRSEVGHTVIITYEWKEENYKVIYCNFTNDKLSFKSQANLE